MICTEDWVAVEEIHPVVGGGIDSDLAESHYLGGWGWGQVHCGNVTHRPQLTALWTPCPQL